MKSRLGSRLMLGLFAFLFSAGTAFAQGDRAPDAGLLGGMIVLALVVLFLIAMYVYLSLAIQTIAEKTSTDNAWLAWIPIVNLILLLNIAGKPLWWIILFFIPLVNLVITAIVWMAVAEAREKANWWGILMVIPPVSLIVPGYLAWAD